MTLIIGVRSNNECLVIADRRNLITENGVSRFEDDYRKIVIVHNLIVYNHGYNRIDNEDWKLRAHDLTPDTENPIYSNILIEMQTKPYQEAFFVFVNMKELFEISIIVNKGISGKIHTGDWIVSGSGEKYVDLMRLDNLRNKDSGFVRNRLKRTFTLAHEAMTDCGGAEFSKEFYIKSL